MQILFEVARQDLITERLNTTVDAIRTRLRADKIGYADLGGSGRTVQVRIRDAADIAKAKAALAELLLPTAPPADEPTSMTEWATDGARRLASAGFPGRKSGGVNQRIVHGGA